MDLLKPLLLKEFQRFSQPQHSWHVEIARLILVWQRVGLPIFVTLRSRPALSQRVQVLLATRSDVQDPQTGRTEQTFVGRSGEEMSSNAFHINRQVPERLRRIDQIKDTVLSCNLPNRLDRLQAPR